MKYHKLRPRRLTFRWPGFRICHSAFCGRRLTFCFLFLSGGFCHGGFSSRDCFLYGSRFGCSYHSWFLGRRLRCLNRGEVIFPEVDVEMVATSGMRSPQLAGRKPNAVERLRIFTLAMRIGVGIDKRAVNNMDFSLSPAHITREARVTRRVQVLSNDTVSHFETRLQSPFVAATRCAAVNNDRNCFGRERWFAAHVRARGHAGCKFLRGEEALLKCKSL